MNRYAIFYRPDRDPSFYVVGQVKTLWWWSTFHRSEPMTEEFALRMWDVFVRQETDRRLGSKLVGEQRSEWKP